MRWQARRGLLNPLDGSPPGSAWWRKINERLLQDGCESVALAGGLAGEPSSPTVRLWLAFIEAPTGRNWYRAQNASIVAAYLEHRALAEAERLTERFFMTWRSAVSSMPTRSSARRGWRLGDSRRSAGCSAIPASGWPGPSSHSEASYPTAIHSPERSRPTSPTSIVSVGC